MAVIFMGRNAARSRWPSRISPTQIFNGMGQVQNSRIQLYIEDVNLLQYLIVVKKEGKEYTPANSDFGL